jgi:ankyrin repeat protein
MKRNHFFAARTLRIFFVLPVLAAQAASLVSEDVFLESASKNDLATVKRYLEQGGDVNARNYRGKTALMFAAHNGNAAMARLLIEKGAELNAHNNSDWTPLCFAAEKGHVEIIKIIMAEQEEGFSLSLWDPLEIACKHNRIDVVRTILLLHRYEGLSSMDRRCIPLWKISIAKNEFLSAVGRGDLKKVQMLLSGPGGYDAVTLQQAIDLSQQEGHIELQEYLQKNGQAFIDKAKNQTKLDEDLRKAVAAGDYEKVSALLYKGADILSSDDIAHWNSLQLAARTGHLEILKKLLADDKEGKLFSQFSESLLCGAAEERRVDMVRYLARRIGPAKRIYDYPLIRLVESDDVDILRLMVHQGADVNAIPKWCSDTPLIRAARKGKVRAAKFLIQHGTDVNARDGKGLTALDYAHNEGNNEVAQVLTQDGGRSTSSAREMESPLFSPEVLDNPDRLKTILSRGADLKARDQYGWTPLLYALNYGHPDAAKIMIESGADVNDQGDIMDPCPPLAIATEFAQLELVKLLVSKGADVNAPRSYDGRTALILAASKNNLGIVKFLLAHGARTDIKDRMNKTAEDLARESGYTDILNALKQK